MNTYIAPGSFLIFLQQDGGGGSFINLLFPMVLIFGIFYFLIIRPQQKKQRQAQTERDELLSSLKPNDKVITSGGLYGTIIGVRENTGHVEIGQSGSIQVFQASIARAAASHLKR